MHRLAATIEADGRYPSRRTQPLIHILKMIEHYSDHAANERTFLAWVRTAIAIMAFGFLVEKFDLFLRLAGASRVGEAAASAPGAARLWSASGAGGGQFVGDLAGLLLILLGGATMAFAAIRFAKTARDIDARETLPGPGRRLDVMLVVLLLLLGGVLFVYLIYTLISRI
jgi:putative membrane protein